MPPVNRQSLLLATNRQATLAVRRDSTWPSLGICPEPSQQPVYTHCSWKWFSPGSSRKGLSSPRTFSSVDAGIKSLVTGPQWVPDHPASGDSPCLSTCSTAWLQPPLGSWSPHHQVSCSRKHKYAYSFSHCWLTFLVTCSQKCSS